MKNKFTGKEKEDEMQKYFFIFEEILSGMDSRMTEIQKETRSAISDIESVKQGFQKYRQQTEKRFNDLDTYLGNLFQSNKDVTSTKLPTQDPSKFFIYISLLLSLVSLVTSIHLFLR